MKTKLSTLIFIVSLVSLIGISPKTALAAQAHPAGTLIQSGSSVWQIDESGKKRIPFDSAEKFYSWRLSFDRVVPANIADLALSETTAPEWGDGVLFADNNVIYQISDGKKHGFTSADIFLGQGFTFEMVRAGNLSRLSEGTAITNSGAAHLDGTLLNSNGTILISVNGDAKAFPSEAVFYSQGGTYSQVVPANSRDKTTDLGIMTFRTGTLVNDGGAIWAIQNNTKLGFPSAACFVGFGFNFGSVVNGSTADYKESTNICGANADGTPVNNVAAYTDQYVVANPGQFQVKMETFDLSSGKVRVLTDAADDYDCTASCSEASLKTFADANNATYGMNGTYFCPDDYSTCKSIANSYFWKVIDSKTGLMINERSGLGENDPFLTFDSVGQPKYFKRWSDYKDSNFKASAGINSPSLIENGAVNLDESKLDNAQKTSRSTRGAIAVKGNTLYLLQVYGATVPDSANALKALGVDYALLLDGGGSTAILYEGAYKIGPGRGIPNAVLVQVLP